MKLQTVLRQCGLQPSKMDKELWLKFDDRSPQKLLALITIHVDDLKMAGEPHVIMQIQQTLQKEFGELKIAWCSFVNCGVRHIQDENTKEVTLDQLEFVRSLCPIVDSALTGRDEVLCEPALHSQYRSLLGALAYAVHTRPDLSVFVVSLQRGSAKPNLGQVKRLNSVLQWTQRNPKVLKYIQIDNKPSELVVVSDAAFKRETDDGYSLRGAAFSEERRGPIPGPIWAKGLSPQCTC